ncbi:MAG: hypothetical protein KA369_03085 [Spirochaetes bacterium]|nr:hypothetical protein [Spirochaetota bacterium]
MQITCASCKTSYNLTMDQILGLSSSILPCNACNKYIKITTCPHCKSYYSITFSSSQQTKYRLSCERCSREFEIEFPVIKEGVIADDTPKREKKKPPEPSFFKKLLSSSKKNDSGEPALSQKEDRAPSWDRPVPGENRSSNFTLEGLLSICGTAFTAPKLATASIVIVIGFIFLLIGNWLVGVALGAVDLGANEYVKSLLTIIPFAILLFLYLMGASIISRMTLDTMHIATGASPPRISRFLAESLVPVFLANIIIFLVIDLVFILFGKIPVIGPVIFALLFFPIYFTSLCAVILLAIGFWFYPPIIAVSIPRGESPITALMGFIRRRNFSLVYIIPLMTIITAVTFGAIYLLHYGSFALSIFLSKTVLGDEGLKTFSSIPSTLLQLSDLTIIGSDSGLYKSLLDNLLMTHAVGGIIIGVLFTSISILLFSAFISITATLSTRIFLMMEKGSDMDDTATIRLLALLVLLLLGVFLVKKIFF